VFSSPQPSSATAARRVPEPLGASAAGLSHSHMERAPVPADIDEIFTRGGKQLIDLLDYSVRAVQTDVLFVFLVREYRELPATPKAVALFDIFCAPQAPARLRDPEILSPFYLQLEAAIRPMKSNLAEIQAAHAGAGIAPSLFLPQKFLFDAIDVQVRKKSSGLRAVEHSYRPDHSPLENLPGGRMSAQQRHFVEKVWEPDLRPRLVAAGFRRMGSIA
jgi:hypothetical protein